MQALLIIDMQSGSFTATTPRFDTEGVVDRINRLSAHFRGTGNPVIFIQHDGTKEGNFVPGTNEWQVLSSLDVQPTDIRISKTANDCFYRSRLGQVLTDNQIDELVITGCATDFCVDTTIRAAMTKDYKITVIKDAHTTANRPHASAETVITHHNWLWENMIPTGSSIRVISLADWMEQEK